MDDDVTLPDQPRDQGRIENAARRETLIARRGNAEPVYCFDIHLQGEAETVFFDV